MKTFLKGFIFISVLLSLTTVSGSATGDVIVHRHKDKRKDYNVVDVSGLKYESYDSKGNKVSSGTLKFTTKYLDTDDSIYS